MVMERSEYGLSRLGHHDLAKQQAKIRAELQRRNPDMSDIPLTGQLPRLPTARPEITLPPLSAETQSLIEHMESDGYALYETFGKSPDAVRSEGIPFWYLNPALEDRTAPPALLAFKFKPSEFFLHGSQNIPHDKQLELVEEEKVRVEKQYPGTGLVVREGKLSEWTELAWKNFQTTKVRIFGKDFGFNWTWADDYESDESGAGRACVGAWVEALGLYVALDHPGSVGPHLRLASLVEIPRK